MLDAADFSHLPRDKAELAYILAEELKQREIRKQSREDFLTFVKTMWPSFIEGAHHRKMSQTFNRIARGELKRVIINNGSKTLEVRDVFLYVAVLAIGAKSPI